MFFLIVCFFILHTYLRKFSHPPHTIAAPCILKGKIIPWDNKVCQLAERLYARNTFIFMRKYYQHMETAENSVLLKELQQGNLRSFNALYYKYYPTVFANICRLVKKQEDAEEILQDVFITLWDKRETLDPDGSIGGWLMVVSQNKSINYLQKKVREKLHFIGAPTDETLPDVDIKDAFDIEAQLAHLDKAINNLPPKQRQAFTLCKLHHKTYGQASELLGISPYTVREYVTKAAERIKWEMVKTNPDVLFIALISLHLLSAARYC